MPTDLTIRPAETDADLETWSRIRRLVVPEESAPTVAQLRAEASEDRLLVVAEVDGTPVGSGLADRSQIAGAFVAPRVIEAYRRRGTGTAILRILLDHAHGRGYRQAAAQVVDDGSFAFANSHGFVEVDREVEQVRSLSAVESVLPYPGIEFTTVAADPRLLERAYDVAAQGYADMVLARGPVTVPLDEWLRDEATLPAGSFVALVDGRVVGYAGLIAWNGDPTLAENGLTAVDRSWRGRGLATALKQRQLAWAAANGIREIVTWTQQGNEAMQHVNHRLGYISRSISRTLHRELP
jgi:mycothiol synthase